MCGSEYRPACFVIYLVLLISMTLLITIIVHLRYTSVRLDLDVGVCRFKLFELPRCYWYLNCQGYVIVLVLFEFYHHVLYV